ncbi:MAG: hypothetical protein HC904_10865 [Blastochloris sp.]|nr:hypothetical protein [Blastochloris sp.]
MEWVSRLLLDSLVILLKIYVFVCRALTQNVSNTDLAVACLILLIAFFLLYGILYEIVLVGLTYIPALSSHPPFYPSSEQYQVKFTRHDRPTPFRWQYPYVIVDGAEYNIRLGSFHRGKQPRAVLRSGTVIEFIPR